MKPPKQMTALSIAQPWAQCVIEYGKNVENKTTNLKKRGAIAIYASSSYQSWRFESCQDDHKINLDWDDVEKGVIVGFVDVIDVITPKQKNIPSKYKKWWVPGHFGYVLANPIMLKTPVNAKPPNGAISFWYLKGKTLDACLKQIPASKRSNFRDWK